MDRLIQVLYVDDSRFDRELVRDALEKEHGGFRITEAASRSEFERWLARDGFDLVLSDFNILGFEGLDVIDMVRAQDPRLPVMIVTGTGSEQTAVEAMKRGAADYVIKTPHHIRRLAGTIMAVLERNRLQEEHLRAKEALLTSAREWQVTFDAIGDAICLLDPERRILRCNRTMAALLGGARGAATGCLCAEVLHGCLDRPEGCAAARAGESLRRETELLQMNGRWFSVTVDPLLDGSGKLLGAVHTMSDITERKRAEEVQLFLAGVNEMLASSLDCETSLAGVARLAVPILADVCAIHVLEGSMLHPVAAHADPLKVGPPQEKLRGHPFALNGQSPLERALRTGRLEFYPELPEPGAGANDSGPNYLATWREMGFRSAIIAPLAVGERILGAISLGSAACGSPDERADGALAEDLARRVALALDNARLFRAAEAAIRLRDDFISVAAHELRTPITSLRGFAQLTLRRLERDGVLDQGQTAEALAVIDRQSDKLSRLVSQLLDVSRIDARSLSIERKTVDAARLVEDVVRGARMIAGSHPLVVKVASPTWAAVDPLRLEQVLTNLIDNAVRYSLNDRPIDIDLSVPVPETVRLSVRDRGIGIPPEHRQRIFERYHQVPTNLTSGGLGLGLHISRHIVELHGGRIEVESPADGGTCFVVNLPTGLTGQAGSG